MSEIPEKMSEYVASAIANAHGYDLMEDYKYRMKSAEAAIRAMCDMPLSKGDNSTRSMIEHFHKWGRAQK